MSILLPHFLKEGRGRLDVYFTRVFNPVWTYPDGFSWIEVLRDPEKIGLHVALVDGDEDKMGPQWFFEGFAVLGAGQKLGGDLAFDSSAQALAAAKDTHSPLAYRRFGAAVRYFSTKTPLPTLVRRAHTEDFETWLLQLK